MSVESSINWQEIFVERAKRLEHQNSLIDSRPFADGLVVFQEERPCRNCGQVGVYSGVSIFSGHLFNAVNADYCPNCTHVTQISSSHPLISTDPRKFLPVVRQRLRDFPQLASETTPGPPCPICEVGTHVLEVGKGVINNFRHKWTVCNTGCGWEGEYAPVI